MVKYWKLNCTVGPRAANDSGFRRARDIDLIVIHSAEAADSFGKDTSAEGVANYFARKSTQASTQIAVDRDSCVRMLPDLVIPWGARGANHDGLHIEICGYAHWRMSEWRQRSKMLERAAGKVAKWCWLYDIPLRWLSVRDLKEGDRGLTTHADVNAAFKGGDHWDPGPGFPRTDFMRYVRSAYSEIEQDRDRG